MQKNRQPLLLDTHCWVWIQTGDGHLSRRALEVIDDASGRGALLLSAISVWELGMLVCKSRLTLSKPLLDWAQEALRTPGLSLVPLSPEIAIESNQLPGGFHGDPADRMIVASARYTGATLLTRDQDILSYSEEGHVRSIAA